MFVILIMSLAWSVVQVNLIFTGVLVCTLSSSASLFCGKYIIPLTSLYVIAN